MIRYIRGSKNTEGQPQDKDFSSIVSIPGKIHVKKRQMRKKNPNDLHSQIFVVTLWLRF
jgi:hypothetical protein